MLQRFVRNKHSSLFARRVSKENSWGQYYKILQIHNLEEIDKFRSKLASSLLDEHTSLKKHLLTTESVQYESVMFFIVQDPRGFITDAPDIWAFDPG